MMNSVTLKYFIAIILVAMMAACNPQQTRSTKLQGSTMGTHWHIILSSSPQDTTIHELQQTIEKRLQDINHLFSTYQQDSIISHFNQHKSTKPYPVPKEFYHVIQAAQKIGKDTQGAFDITIAPLVNLWGFGANFVVNPPSAESIEQAKNKVGYRQLILLENETALTKTNKNLEIDLSAIAKGYAVDEIAAILEQHQLQNYMVEIGGEIKLKGQNPEGECWKIAIQQPDQSLPEMVISQSQTAIATSGDYQNYFTANGKRYSHTLDPATGSPVTHHLASVTVLHESTMVADALATALSVMGADKGITFAEQHKLKVYIITRTDKGYKANQTSHFH